MNTINDLLLSIRKDIESSKPAIIKGSGIQDYGSFVEEIDALSSSFRYLGVKKGEVVAFLLDDSPFLLKAVLAVSRIGGVFMGISPKLPFDAICELIRQSKAKLLLAKKGGSYYREKELPGDLKIVTESEIKNLSMYDCQSESETVCGGDPCGIILTSGTTGINKGVIHSHKNFLIVGESCASAWEIKGTDRLMSMIPLLTGATFGSLILPALLRGASIVMPNTRKDYDSIARHNVTFLMGNPTNFKQMIDTIDWSWQRQEGRGTIAGAPIPPGLLERVEEKSGFSLYPHYGMTELLAITTAVDNKEYSVGKPFKGVSIRIEDKNRRVVEDGAKGEVVCNSPCRYLGYLGKQDLTKDKGWFRTGDLGFINKKGNLVLTGRVKDCIIRGGNNIYPEEIEAFASRYTGIKECAVVGIPHNVYGEALALCIVPSKEMSIKEDDLKGYLSRFLPVFKIPDFIVKVEVIPRTFNGKISRHKLKEMIGR